MNDKKFERGEEVTKKIMMRALIHGNKLINFTNIYIYMCVCVWKRSREILCYMLLYPSAMSFMHNSCNASGSNILVVAEGCQLTLWDLRMKTNGSCFQWICGSVGDIYYDICSSTIGNSAIGGADRTLTLNHFKTRHLAHKRLLD
ncbi:hypothetical protein CsatB_019798 [Cannabis sativa]